MTNNAVEFRPERKGKVRIHVKDEDKSLMTSVALYDPADAQDDWSDIEDLILASSKQHLKVRELLGIANKQADDADKRADVAEGQNDDLLEVANALRGKLDSKRERITGLEEERKRMIEGHHAELDRMQNDFGQQIDALSMKHARLARWRPRRVWAFLSRQEE